jgi:hypothetical protein
MHRILFALALIFQVSCFAQNDHINPRSLDSLKKHIDSSAKAVRAGQDTFMNIQDSFYKAQMDKRVEQAVKNAFENERELEKQRKRQNSIRIGIATLFLVFLVAGLILRRKKSKGKGNPF